MVPSVVFVPVSHGVQNVFPELAWICPILQAKSKKNKYMVSFESMTLRYILVLVYLPVQLFEPGLVDIVPGRHARQ